MLTLRQSNFFSHLPRVFPSKDKEYTALLKGRAKARQKKTFLLIKILNKREWNNNNNHIIIIIVIITIITITAIFIFIVIIITVFQLRDFVVVVVVVNMTVGAFISCV